MGRQEQARKATKIRVYGGKTSGKLHEEEEG
jgi:hypothetical protein